MRLYARSYRSKLQAAFLLLGLAAIGATGWEASAGATAALRQATSERLTSIAEMRRRQVERYLEDLGDHVLALSSDESTILALEDFREAWPRITPVQNASESLKRLYRNLTEWMPADGRALSLQERFVAANPYPEGARADLLTPTDAGGVRDYVLVHTRFHPTLYRYQSAFKFYDIFLIDASTGRVLYTVQKELDLGANLLAPPYSGTALASAFRRAVALNQAEKFVVEDYTPYAPSAFEPAAFVAAPIFRAGSKIGVLAIQVSADEVNRVMTGDGMWQDEGFGETGQAYIVGPDNLLRSDIRPSLEQPERHKRTAILRLSQDQVAGSMRALRIEAPLSLPGLRWRLIAEIGESEALSPIRDLRLRIFGLSLLTALALFVAARVLAQSVTRPVLALARSADRLGKGDFGARVPVESQDEIGLMAESFNRMAEQLQQTTASKQELKELTQRLITAQEDERSRLARELHDDVTQRLAAVAIEAGRAGQQTIKERLAGLADDLHDLARRLHPAILEDLGLVAAIEHECRGFFERGGPPVEFVHDEAVETGSPDVQLALYRIVQEGLRNISRHADASEVQIRLERHGDQLHLEIRDDGSGFDRNSRLWRPGLGLASMEERAEQLAGVFAVHSEPGKGATIRVRVPAFQEPYGKADSSAG